MSEYQIGQHMKAVILKEDRETVIYGYYAGEDEFLVRLRLRNGEVVCIGKRSITLLSPWREK